MEFDLEEPKYKSIDSKAMDLLKKMLHEDPKDRISASQAMESPYFWSIHKYSKILDTPVTNGCANLGMCDDFEEGFTPIRQRLEFEVRN